MPLNSKKLKTAHHYLGPLIWKIRHTVSMLYRGAELVSALQLCCFTRFTLFRHSIPEGRTETMRTGCSLRSLINKISIIRPVYLFHERGESHITQYTSNCRWKYQTCSHLRSFKEFSDRYCASYPMFDFRFHSVCQIQIPQKPMSFSSSLSKRSTLS